MRPVQFAFIFLLLFFNLSAQQPAHPYQYEKTSYQYLNFTYSNCDPAALSELIESDEIFKNIDARLWVDFFNFYFSCINNSDLNYNYFDTGFLIHQQLLKYRNSLEFEYLGESGYAETFYLLWGWEAVDYYFIFDDKDKARIAINSIFIDEIDNIELVLKDIVGSSIFLGPLFTYIGNSIETRDPEKSLEFYEAADWFLNQSISEYGNSITNEDTMLTNFETELGSLLAATKIEKIKILAGMNYIEKSLAEMRDVMGMDLSSDKTRYEKLTSAIKSGIRFDKKFDDYPLFAEYETYLLLSLANKNLSDEDRLDFTSSYVSKIFTDRTEYITNDEFFRGSKSIVADFCSLDIRQALIQISQNENFEIFIENHCDNKDTRAIEERIKKERLFSILGEDNDLTESENLDSQINFLYLLFSENSTIDPTFIGCEAIEEVFVEMSGELVSLLAEDYDLSKIPGTINLYQATIDLNLFIAQSDCLISTEEPISPDQYLTTTKLLQQKLLSLELPDIDKEFPFLNLNFKTYDSGINVFDSIYIDAMSGIKTMFQLSFFNENKDGLPNIFNSQEVVNKVDSLVGLYLALIWHLAFEVEDYQQYDVGFIAHNDIDPSNLKFKLLKFLISEFMDLTYYLRLSDLVPFTYYDKTLKSLLYTLAIVDNSEISNYMRLNHLEKKLKHPPTKLAFDEYHQAYKDLKRNVKKRILDSANCEDIDWSLDSLSSMDSSTVTSCNVWFAEEEFKMAQERLMEALIDNEDSSGLSPEYEIFKLPSSTDEFFEKLGSQSLIYMIENQTSEAIYIIDIRGDLGLNLKPSISWQRIGGSVIEQALEYQEAIKIYPPPKNFNELQLSLSKAFTQYYTPCTAFEKNITIISDGSLREFPFHTLKVDINDDTFQMTSRFDEGDSSAGESDYRYLIEFCNFSYMPSLQSALYLKEGLLDIADMHFVGFGNPKFNSSSFDFFKTRGLSDVNELKKLSQLIESEDEIRSIAGLFKDSTIYLGERANEINLRLINSSPYFKNTDKLVYFATHSLPANSEISNDPGLALTPPDTPSVIDDGLLAFDEIADLDLSGDYVTLAACKTFDGLYPGSEKYTGLPAAFFSAGANGLLLSMWDIESTSAAEFNKILYGKMFSEKLSFQEAISAASIELINSEKYSHPYFWGPYFYLGAHPILSGTLFEIFEPTLEKLEKDIDSQ